jgi:DNA-binding NtrC family response regulator
MIRQVLFLDDDDDLREIAVELFGAMGIICDAAASAAELEEVFDAHGDAIDLAILDINLGAGRPSGIDAYRWLRRHGYAGRIAFLTGHGRSHPLVDEAIRTGDASVHEKPVSAPELRALLG